MNEKLKPLLKIFCVVILCWGIFVSVEGFRLIESTDPGKYPLLCIATTQIADEIAEYHSLGFSQVYYLSYGDIFVYGEFNILGQCVARWGNDD